MGVAKEYLAMDTIHLASRLDRETSGVVLLAKHRKAASYWQKGIECKSVRRCYLSIVEGELTESKKVSTYLGNDPFSEVYVKQMVTENSRKAKFAETIFTPLFSSNQSTIVSFAVKAIDRNIGASFAAFTMALARLASEEADEVMLSVMRV